LGQAYKKAGMIPLSKLAKLPRHQRLRKTCKIFAGAERCLAEFAAGRRSAESGVTVDPKYLAGLAEMLLAEGGFSPAVKETLRRAANTIKAAGFPENAENSLLRPLNTIRHLLLAETGRFPADWDFVDHGGRLNPAARRIFPGMNVYLEDIRSPFNVGAMFRTAESFGCARLYLSPHCANPLHPRAERTAMGCVGVLDWERLSLEKLIIEKSSAPGHSGGSAADTPVPFFALETGGTPLRDFPFPQTGVMIAGSEELGISPEALALVDASLGRVSIPSYGAKASLNVSAAFAIAMQAWSEALVR
jgi:TrmH family RNA methyltransferase